MYRIAIILLTWLSCVFAGTKGKPHDHQGILEPYSGKPIDFEITQEQLHKLENGEAVTFKERIGISGRGIVIQDVNASEPVCMEKIMDLTAYSRMVPNVKSVQVYESRKFPNGTSKTGAQFDVGALGLRFGYYLLLTHEPKHKTLTWTLDYRYNSDFDDNVGHWQVMPHPKKRGWSRVLYSTKVKLLSWIPEFVVNFLTGKALIESTTWLKREAEAEEMKRSNVPPKSTSFSKWFGNGGSTWKMNLAATKEKLEQFRYRDKVRKLLPHSHMRRPGSL